MGSPAGGALRVFRTLAITAVIVGLAATAHVVGGGGMPRPLGVAGVALGTAYVCAWAARRRLSATAITALLATGQWALHHAFDLLDAATCAPPAGHAGHAGEHTPALVGCSPGLADASSVLGASHAPAASWAMLAAHVVATLGTAVLLASGERAVWALFALLSAYLPAVPRPSVPPVPAARQAPAAPPALRPRRAALLRVSPRRGPPAAVSRPFARLAF